NATGLAVSSLVGLRTATIQMDAHFLEPVSGGRITCRAEVVHRTRRTATAEGRIYDEEGNLVAIGAGVFRIFEKEGNPIV
ncbi:MAG: PaaI family thioesterase, partial [Actinomycetota bacterium]|nr:PaaI family thioesterase [Actinomycetota bacterium]